jgi:hypothetical protein
MLMNSKLLSYPETWGRLVVGRWSLVVGTNDQPPTTNNHHQDAFRTPGIIPDSANSRKQMRQSPKRRRNARERPHRLQRLCCCTANFGLRFDFSIQDFFAMRVLAEM